MITRNCPSTMKAIAKERKSEQGGAKPRPLTGLSIVFSLHIRADIICPGVLCMANSEILLTPPPRGPLYRAAETCLSREHTTLFIHRW